MNKQIYLKLIKLISDASIPLVDKPNKYSSLLEKIGDARFVLIGEASHGTNEFYKARNEITLQLIKKKNFMAVAIEADWPDAYRIHRYIQGMGSIKNYESALEGFNHFPIWMWRNVTLPPFIKTLRKYNDLLSPQDVKIGFYGLDLYSLYPSIQEVIDYLSKVDPEAAQRAQSHYTCFDLKTDPQTYGYLTSMGTKKPCTKEVIEEYLQLQHRAFDYLRKDSLTTADEYFYATQNARLIKNAEHYYRSMYEGHNLSWNVRDKHMAETLNLLADHLENRYHKPAKIIVWAHNSHIGDARATEMSTNGEINLGQLVREQHDNNSYLIGFSTYQGFVTAASRWGKPAERKLINPGLDGSYEKLFHQIKYPDFLLHLRDDKELEHYLRIPRLQRAIGVIYSPKTERDSHYFLTRLAYQFDSIIHFDETTAVQPLEVNPEWREELTLSNE